MPIESHLSCALEIVNDKTSMAASVDGYGPAGPSASSTVNGSVSPSDPLSISVQSALGGAGPGLVSKSAFPVPDFSPSYQSQQSTGIPFGYKRETAHRVFVNRSLYVMRI